MAILWMFWLVFNSFFAAYDIDHGHNGFGLFHAILAGFSFGMFICELFKEF